jgi:RNA-directed DNA polymerase
VLSPIGLRLSEEKTTIAHIDVGFDFLGFRIQRQRKRGSHKLFVYTWPSKRALSSIKAKVKAITYFQHGSSKATFGYLRHYTWFRVVRWLRRKYRRASWKQLRRIQLGNGLWPEHDGLVLFNPAAVPVTRYRYRGARIPTPWDGWMTKMAA